MDNVKVTVWLSTYNQAPYVAQALDSILMQKTTFPFEVIAADDCSTDGTQEIILQYQKQYPDQILPYFTNPNVGGCRKLCDCIDKGLFRGEYISFLEGDDYWLGEDRLQTLVDFLDAHPEYSRVAHQRVLVDEEGVEFGPDIPPELLEKVFTIEDFLQGRDYSDFGSVFRNYFKTVGNKYHPLLLASKNVCDFQDMFITQDFGPVYLLKDCFGAYRCKRTASATNYNSITTPSYRSKDHIQICNEIEAFYEGRYDLSPFIRKSKRRILASAIEACNEQELQEARKYLSASEVASFLPELYFSFLQRKNKKTIAFVNKQLHPEERKFLLPRCFAVAWKHVFKRRHKSQDNATRGYVVRC